MTDNTDEIEGIFESMVQKGLLSTGNGWLETAIEQKNPRVTIDLAQSEIMVYDLLDQFFVGRDLN